MAKYFPLSIEPVEDIEHYRPGGFHPVHLGEIYDERYKVLHKLGAGGYSTTWLAHDELEARNVALKMIKASETANCVELKSLQLLSGIQSDHPGRAHIRNLLTHFTISGPNGKHYCLVSEVAGPTLPSLYDARDIRHAGRLRAGIARKLAKQFVQAVGFLHSSGIGHGDLTVPNILLKLKSIDSWTESEIYERLGSPRKEQVRTSSGSGPSPSAPSYIVQAAKVPEARYLAHEIFLIDLGVSFPLVEPPKPDDIGVPLMYQAPETIFESKYDRYSELWSVACVLFELRAGSPIFESFIGTKDEVIRQWVQMKGKMPEPWWSSWDTRSSAFDEDGKPLPRGPNDLTWTTQYPLQEMIADIGEEDVIDESLDVDIPQADDLASLLEAPGSRVGESEAQDLGDLLEKTLQWKPEDRMGIEQILEHPWFES